MATPCPPARRAAALSMPTTRSCSRTAVCTSLVTVRPTPCTVRASAAGLCGEGVRADDAAARRRSPACGSVFQAAHCHAQQESGCVVQQERGGVFSRNRGPCCELSAPVALSRSPDGRFCVQMRPSRTPSSSATRTRVLSSAPGYATLLAPPPVSRPRDFAHSSARHVRAGKRVGHGCMPK